MEQTIKLKKISVSIVIVSYNTKMLLLDCIKSVVEKSRDVEYEIIVVDNASTDGSCEELLKKYPSVRLIRSAENLGFGRANNLGLRNSQGKYILYLNSDTVFINNALKFFLDYVDDGGDEKIGVIGTFLLNSNFQACNYIGAYPSIKHLATESVKNYIRRFFNKRMFEQVTIDETRSHVLTDRYIIGAAMFLSADVAREYTFDEQLFMYADEADLQWRLVKKGFTNIIIEGPLIIHLEGSSGEKKFDGQLFKLVRGMRSLFYYVKKHYSYFYYLIFRLVFCFIILPQFFSRKLSIRFKRRLLYSALEI